MAVAGVVVTVAAGGVAVTHVGGMATASAGGVATVDAEDKKNDLSEVLARSSKASSVGVPCIKGM